MAGRLARNLQGRMDNARMFFRREVDIIKGAASDVKERFDLDLQTEPRNTRGTGILSSRGAVYKVPAWVVGQTIDNVIRTTQNSARLNRELVLGARIR